MLQKKKKGLFLKFLFFIFMEWHFTHQMHWDGTQVVCDMCFDKTILT